MRKSFVFLTACAIIAMGTGAFATAPNFRAGQPARQFTQAAPKAAEEHAHPEHGPHGGHLIELGKEGRSLI